MASFISNMFPSSQGSRDARSAAEERPGTPSATKNAFIEPAITPQGSPSKKTIPPGAHELPTAFENALKLNASALDSPVKLRPNTSASPLAPARSNVQPTDDASFSPAAAVDNSIIHKTAQSPDAVVKKQGQENTPPSRSRIPMLNHNQAALSRHELYQSRDNNRPITPTTRKFNTGRGLTPEELEILKKPSVRRLVNVTQLCKRLRLPLASRPFQS